ncbi:MAG: hypothetical protein AAB677_03460 [Patescibacteria group bacterium]
MKKHLAVILAFALPILLVIGIALSVYWPSWSLSTEYDFVYATCGSNYQSSYPYNYNCADYLNNYYQVKNGKLTIIDVKPLGPPSPRESAETIKPYVPPATHLFRHDSQKNEGREITLAEAQTLQLNELLTAPDGVSVESSYNRGEVEFFPFFNGGSSHYGYYLTKGNKRQELNLVGEESDRYYYNRDSFKFIGWIIK